ncbi:MAG: hypothetical protein M3Q75_04780, partial [Gemmatimonadota bacterium]|nr:hypothetical protein [Gemmatimonadota bacterium]
FGAPVTTTLGTTPNFAYSHVFTYDGITPLAPKSYSVSYGQSGAGDADKILGFLFNGLSLSGGRDGFDLSSSGWGKAMTVGGTLGTLAATGDINPVPVSPLQGSLFLDSTAAALGTTRLLDIYGMDLAFGERLARARPINALLTSDGVVEVADQEHTLQLQFGVDAIERARYAKVRTGTKEFVRVGFEGGVTADPVSNYSLRADICLLWTESGASEDTDNVLTKSWTGRVARDSTWGMAAQITVVNARSAL